MNEVLHKEIGELIEDRETQAIETEKSKKRMEDAVRRMDEDRRKINEFIAEELRYELDEFQQDKDNLKIEKVNLLKDKERVLEQARQDFIDDQSEKVKETVNIVLSDSIDQFRDSIEEAKQNEFGRKI